MMPKTLLLIDAHALIHRSFHALPPLSAPDGRPVGALYGLASILLKTLAADKPDYVAAAFDRPEPTLRKQEYKEYKAHRPPAPDELISQLRGARELFETFGVACFEKPGYEGDDIVGTLAKKFGEKGFRVEILTGDLDTLQLVEDDHIVVRTMKKGVSDTFVYDEAAVRERYDLSPSQLTDYKGLVGDASDNIPGVRGVGPKTATELLKKFGTLENIFEKGDPKDKLAAKVLPFKKEALFSRKLGTIDTKVPIPETTLESLTFTGVPSEKLGPYFESLGFDSLLRRIGAQRAVARAPKPAAPPSLFGAPEIQDTPEPDVPSDPNIVVVLDADDAQKQKSALGSDALKIAFEWKPVIRKLLDEGVVPAQPLFDISVAGWLLDPDGSDFTLPALTKKYLPSSGDMAPRETQRKLAGALGRALRKEGVYNVFESIEMPVVPVLAEMERTGIAVNRKHLVSLLSDLDREIARETEEIYAAAGGPFNLNSPRQVGEVVFERLKLELPKVKKTATGQRRMNRDVLESLKDLHPIIARILEYREDFKIRSSFVAPLLDLTTKEGRVHTTLIQTGTGTGRIASEKPNLQNIPQESRWSKRLRDSFVAGEGWTLLSVDYSQIELRLLAHLTGDDALIRAFRDGKDIHAFTASKVLHIQESDVTKETRRLAKTLNFGMVYGMGARAFAQTSGVSAEEARRFIDEYFAAFPTIKRWQEGIKEKARAQGYVENANGRKRWFPGRGGPATGEFDRAAINMPLQSLNADILKVAMARVDALLRERARSETEIRLLLSIHDELLFEVRDGILNETAGAIRKVMEEVYTLSVPLRVEASAGKSWGELKPL